MAETNGIHPSLPANRRKGCPEETMSYQVLVVDDSAAMRGFIRRVLDLSGFEVGRLFEAADGLDALAVLEEHSD